MPLAFLGNPARLDAADFDACAKLLGCAPAAVHAVCEVESAGRGFLPDGRPVILYEAHVFSRLTGHRFDASHPLLSAPQWNRALYGPGGAYQYDRLEAAVALDRPAALQATSWGLFQILGENYHDAGYPGVEPFVEAMRQGEWHQLAGFADFCLSTGLAVPLAGSPPDWSLFARRYNGPGQVDHYASALAGAYAKWQDYDQPAPAAVARATLPATWHTTKAPVTVLRRGDRGSEVLRLQRCLAASGATLACDGVFGAATERAVAAWQSAHGLTPDGIVGPATLAALAA